MNPEEILKAAKEKLWVNSDDFGCGLSDEDFEAYKAATITAVNSYERQRECIRELSEALTELNRCDVCDESGELESDCMKCGGEEIYCLHVYEAIDCPECEGLKTRSRKADAAIASAKELLK